MRKWVIGILLLLAGCDTATHLLASQAGYWTGVVLIDEPLLYQVEERKPESWSDPDAPDEDCQRPID